VQHIDRMLGGKEKEQGQSRTKTRTSKKGKRESKNEGTTGSMRGARQRKFRRIWEKRVQERENRYWTEGEEKRYRMCYEEKENG
jgi:hypothetical protein